MRQLKITKSITDRSDPSVEMYLKEISRIEMISPEEEIELAKMIKKGDQRALEQLVNANLRFAVSVAKQYQNQGLSLSDLINEGNVGLVKAAQKFDHTKGFKFISYAVWWIRQGIMAALSDNSRLVRLPLNRVGAIKRISRTATELELELDRKPTNQEISLALGISEQVLESNLKASAGHVMSIDAPIASDGDGNGDLLDVIASDINDPDINVSYHESQKIETARFLSKLSQRQSQVLKLFFGIETDFPMDLESIAEHLGITRERTRQIKDKALNKLRLMSNKHSGLRECM